ncbi:MAG: UDP-N-acetylmuramoyl-L-alanine--D-glutamate ligase [Gammaproteobacteria bacterium]|nr:UDP-N-acetylmuramoyl-L-alanine--D-glutamate ligase [Gammaproteobacteria bacterium]MDH3934440.1 UDP-N-acetylmuramoyl-L-alanine--D-glutamate ligase [Gammaproteobacteria bacterium]MDH3971313.1 UDP-N-acetylmuramoyl-L-alanine--D-glutamate ligase [Gammaproteobacteria bacterium]MDH3985559.1 UDP-N-acetylmuramoyl-L-alanine--D-glutamate ligase [Gammaproteobacteria bacterium]
MTEMFDKASRTLVIGLGKTGLSVARYLSRQGVSVAIVDSRDQPPELERSRSELPADVALFLGGFHPDAFERAQQIVISPGVSMQQPEIAAALARQVPVMGDIELFAQAATAPVIAITGSNGKSTVVTLLSAMARRAGIDVRTGGNIGTPALDLITDNEPDLYVLELSSFQLETLHSLRPQAAVVLNISDDHLDRYRDLQDYASTKQLVYQNAGLQVVNLDDPVAAALADAQRPLVGFTGQVPAAGNYGLLQHAGERWLARGDTPIMPVANIRMAGRHNYLNALAALALGEAAGLPLTAMVATLAEFQGLPHRMQYLHEGNGVRWFNDSKGTNVGATLAAIDGVDGKVVLIAGGDGKGADFSPLAHAMQRKGQGAVLIGKDACLLETALQGVVPVRQADNMTQAVGFAAEMAQPGDCVLLSPACASTDMYRNFEARGDIFMQAVQELVR